MFDNYCYTLTFTCTVAMHSLDNVHGHPIPQDACRRCVRVPADASVCAACSFSYLIIYDKFTSHHTIRRTMFHDCHSVAPRERRTLFHACHSVVPRARRTLFHACHSVVPRERRTLFLACPSCLLRGEGGRSTLCTALACMLSVFFSAKTLSF